MHHKITLVGNLGQDPELRCTPSGQSVTNLNVATNRRFTDSNGEQRNEVTWFRVSVWGKQAEACVNYLSKGRQVLVEGRLISDPSGNPRIWTRQDGTAAASHEVNAQVVRFLGSRNGNTPADALDDGTETEVIDETGEFPF